MAALQVFRATLLVRPRPGHGCELSVLILQYYRRIPNTSALTWTCAEDCHYSEKESSDTALSRWPDSRVGGRTFFAGPVWLAGALPIPYLSLICARS